MTNIGKSHPRRTSSKTDIRRGLRYNLEMSRYCSNHLTLEMTQMIPTPETC